MRDLGGVLVVLFALACGARTEPESDALSLQLGGAGPLAGRGASDGLGGAFSPGGSALTAGSGASQPGNPTFACEEGLALVDEPWGPAAEGWPRSGCRGSQIRFGEGCNAAFRCDDGGDHPLPGEYVVNCDLAADRLDCRCLPPDGTQRPFAVCAPVTQASCKVAAQACFFQ